MKASTARPKLKGTLQENIGAWCGELNKQVERFEEHAKSVVEVDKIVSKSYDEINKLSTDLSEVSRRNIHRFIFPLTYFRLRLAS